MDDDEINDPIFDTIKQLDILSKQDEINIGDEPELEKNIIKLGEQIEYLLEYVNTHEDELSSEQLSDINVLLKNLFNTSDHGFKNIVGKIDELGLKLDDVLDIVSSHPPSPVSPSISQSDLDDIVDKITHKLSPVVVKTDQSKKIMEISPKKKPNKKPNKKSDDSLDFYFSMLKPTGVSSSFSDLTPYQKKLVAQAKKHFKKVNKKNKRGAKLDIAKRSDNLLNINSEGLRLFTSKDGTKKYDFPFVDDGSMEAISWFSFD
jgi:hypothetical protein